MIKSSVLAKIVLALSTELETLTRSAREAFAAATDPDSKAENKYDTRSLEASYVARGQAQRVAELELAVQLYKGLPNQDNESVVGIGSLVALQLSDETAHYFIGPVAGGTQIEHEGATVDVITPASPLAQKLLGKKLGDQIELSPSVSALLG